MRHLSGIFAAVHLLLVAAGAGLAARVAADVAAAVLRPAPRAPDLAAAAPRRGERGAPPSEDALYRLVGVAPPAPPPAAPEGAAPAGDGAACPDPDRPMVKTTLGLALLAGIFPGAPERSLATIAVLATHETRLLAAGDAIEGARFLGVRPVRTASESSGSFRLVAILCHGGSLEYVEPAGGAEAPVTQPASVGPRGPMAPVGTPSEGVRAVGPDRYEIERARLDRILDSPGEWRNARIAPDGNLFRVYSIQPNSFFAAIGVENGDGVKRINGYEIDTPEKALEIYARLRDSAKVVVELDRGGRTVRKEYVVVP